MLENQWDQVRQDCHRLAVDTRRRIHELTKLPAICPELPEWFSQMFAAPLPDVNAIQLKKQLYDDFQVEVPIHRWNDQPLIRVSIQGYNTPKDVDRLVDALVALLSN